MKSRAIALLAFALLLAGSVAAQTQPSQGQTPAQSPAQTSDQQTPQASTPASAQDSQAAASKKDGDSKPTAQVPMGADPSKVKHDGSLDDVDAIGNRKIGNKGLGDWY